MSTIENNLEKAIKICHLEKVISVQNIKSAIWNENSTGAINELVGIFLNHAPKNTDLNVLIKTIQDCWNNFSHRSLNGKSPFEMVQNQTGVIDKNIISLNDKKYQTTLFDLKCAITKNPNKETKITKWHKNEYAFDYSLTHEKVIEKYYLLQDKKISLIKYFQEISKLVDIDQYFFDGIIVLAQAICNTNQPKKAFELLENAVNNAKTLLPQKFDPDKCQMPWAILENRPYLRLLLERAMLSETIIGEQESIPLYEEILKLNPNDNQGVRGMLATLYLRTGRPTKVIELASRYPNDSQSELAMGEILALLMLNNSEKATDIIKKNLSYLKHLIKELFLKSHKLPKDYRPGYITCGGKDEAYFYWMAQGDLWYNLPHAMEFLEKFC